MTQAGNERGGNGPAADGRPNVLVICTDQQHAGMLSCAGNRYLKTPNMDRLAASGVRFTQAYCANPVCVPSRASLFSGVMPSQLQINSNHGNDAVVTPEILAGGAGHVMARAGYEVVYTGKQHLPECMPMESVGFDSILTTDEREECAQKSAEFIRRPHSRPWFLVTSLINPHDICYAGIRAHVAGEFDEHLMRIGQRELAALDEAMKRPVDVDEETFWRELCPPLPANHEPLPDEPEAMVEHLARRPFKAWIRKNWTERDWRLYRWAYHRLTERVDGELGRVLDALRDSGQEQNTVVILTSDHGDNDSARKTEHKTYPYEQASKVPFIVSQPGRTRAGETDDRLVVNGIDLIPTLCDYAGVAAPAHLRGCSVKPLAEGASVSNWRQYAVIESEVARMIRDEQYKYIVFSHGANRVQLFDLKNDSMERVNLVDDPAFAGVRDRLHAELQRSMSEIGDTAGLRYLATLQETVRQ